MSDNNNSLTAKEVAQQLLQEVCKDNRRETDRHPFFRPVSVTPDNEKGNNYSAFSRDISLGGIGLLHNMPLDTVEATLTITGNSPEPHKIRAKIQWCQPAGEGWYISGVEFLD